MPPRRNAITARNRAYYVSKQAADKQIRAAKASSKRALAKVREYKSSGYALGNSATMLGGAAAAGAVRAYMPTVGALPTDVALSLLTIGAGAAMKKPMLVYLGAGMASAYVGGYAQEVTSNFLYGQGTVAVPTAATGG